MTELTTTKLPWLRWLLWPLALVPVLIWLENNLDLSTSTLFFDATSMSFLWREHWFTRGLIHRFGRLPTALIFLSFLLACLLQWRNQNLDQFARTRFVCISMLVCVVVVNLIKRSSDSACSWDLAEFGGRYPHLSWFGALPPTLAPGHCWPGAFSLSGFVLFAAYFYLYDLSALRGRWATIALVSILIYANVLGFVQVMRGAHALSHQLWTGLFCWYLSLMCYWFYCRAAQHN